MSPVNRLLTHYAIGYDPIKAHDYYMRTRQLHPRQKGNQPAGSHTIPGAKKVTPEIMKQRAEVAQEVSSLQKKLGELNAALKVALSKEGKNKLSPSQAKARKKASSKKYQQSHKSQIKNKARSARLSKLNKARATKAATGGGSSKGSASTGPGSSTAIKAAIAGVQKALVAAKARQRALG